MIHHKKETTSNPKNPRRKPLVDRWKFKDFVEKKKWMEDGLNVRNSLFKNILIPTPYIFIFKTWKIFESFLTLTVCQSECLMVRFDRRRTRTKS